MIFKKTPIIIGLLAIVLLGVFALMFFGKGTHTEGINTTDRNALSAKEDEQSIPSVEVTKPIRKDLAQNQSNCQYRASVSSYIICQGCRLS